MDGYVAFGRALAAERNAREWQNYARNLETQSGSSKPSFHQQRKITNCHAKSRAGQRSCIEKSKRSRLRLTLCRISLLSNWRNSALTIR